VADTTTYLPDEAVVVRGGVMRRKHIRVALCAALRKTGTPCLSVWSAPDRDADEVARLARAHGEHYMPHSEMQTSCAGRLRAEGFALEPTGPEGHYSLAVPQTPTDDDIDRLIGSFDAPRPNPVARST
jgi:hypothetical protein